jgi:hypothetical protein
MTRILSNTGRKNSSRPPRERLWFNFIQRWKKLNVSEIIASNETHKDRRRKKKKKAQAIINVLKKNLFCHNLVHGVLSVWFCEANESWQVWSVFIFLNDRQNYYNFCHFSKVEKYALFSGSRIVSTI